ncbi:zinc knuckle CX2CX4HX4C containing protein [Tanacetum coccineum]
MLRVLLVLLEFVCLKYEVRVLGFVGEGSNHKKKSNVNITGWRFERGNTVNVGYAGQAAEGTTVHSGMPVATTSPVNTGIPNEVNTRPTPFVNIVNIVPTSPTMNGSEQVVQEYVVISNKLSPSSLNKANLQKLDANVPNRADSDVWLPWASVHEFSSTECVDSMLRDGPWMIHEVPIFLNKWSPSVGLHKKELSRVHVWVKFHDVSLVTYTSDGLSLITMKIDTPMMLDSHTNSMCLESLGQSSYVRFLIEIDACNGFSDNLVMVVLTLDGPGYTKETIRVEYEWGPPRCSACLLFGHSVDDCPKAPKRVVNRVDNSKVGSSGAVDDGFTEDLNGDNPVTEEVDSGNKAFMCGVQELLEEICVLVDDEDKPLEKVEYSGDHDSEDEVKLVDNEMASFLALKASGVGYGTNSLLEQ